MTNNLKEVEMVVSDLFKSDIYSLGLTFFKAATNINIDTINEKIENLKIVEDHLDKTQYP